MNSCEQESCMALAETTKVIFNWKSSLIDADDGYSLIHFRWIHPVFVNGNESFLVSAPNISACIHAGLYSERIYEAINPTLLRNERKLMKDEITYEAKKCLFNCSIAGKSWQNAILYLKKKQKKTILWRGSTGRALSIHVRSKWLF